MINYLTDGAALLNLGIAVMLIIFLADTFKDRYFMAQVKNVDVKVLRIFFIAMIVSQAGVILSTDLQGFYWMGFELSLLGACVYVYFVMRNIRKRIDIQIIGAEAYLDIPEDKYAEFAPGVYMRICRDSNSFIHPKESRLEEEIRATDPSKHIVIFFEIREGSRFPLHKHNTAEEIVLSDGEIMVQNNRYLYAGQSIIVQPGKEHFIEALAHSFGISILEK